MNWLHKFLGRRHTASPQVPPPEDDERVVAAEQQRLDSIRLRDTSVAKAERNDRHLRENHFALKFEQAWKRRHV
jgi:hypothetical protein